MGEIRDDYREVAAELMEKAADEPATITPENVYRTGNPEVRALVNRVVDDLLLPESTFLGLEHLEELAGHAREGAACLILMEHYSNFDIPCLYRLLELQGERGKAVAERIVSMAGVKLTEDSPFIRAFSSGYPRIMIYPSRALQEVTDPQHREELERRSAAINMSALREMVRCKHDGRIVLVFPTGTRYRPGKPETRRVLPEVATYLKHFDYLVFIGVDGNVLRVSPTPDMTRDITAKDIVVHRAGPVLEVKAFRAAIREAAAEYRSAEGGEALRKVTAQRITEEIDRIHREIVAYREPLLERG